MTLYTNKAVTEAQFNRKFTNDEFTDILDRFADKDSALLRASAAHRLADLACRPYPGQSSRLSTENYPLFSKASAQLATALLLEKEQAVIDATTQALAVLVRFAVKSNALFAVYMQSVYRANLSSKAALIKALAKFGSLSRGGAINDADLDLLASITSFCADHRFKVALLRTLCSTELYNSTALANRGLSRRRRGSTKGGPDSLREEAKEEVLLSAARLIATRDAIADALIQSSRFRSHSLMARADAGLKVTNQTPDNALRLDGSFLAGLSLIAGQQIVQLDSISLNNSLLHGADLRNTRFKYGQFEGAYLTGARLDKAIFEAASMTGVDFTGASLAGAQLQGADMRFCCLNDADLREAVFGSTTSFEKITPAAFGLAKAEEPAYPQYVGTVLHNVTVNENTNIVGAKWFDADIDKQLDQWLRAHSEQTILQDEV